MMQDKIIGYIKSLGYITSSDVINDLEILNDDYNTLERLICNFINSKSERDKQLLEEFLENCYIGNRIANVSYILKILK